MFARAPKPAIAADLAIRLAMLAGALLACVLAILICSPAATLAKAAHHGCASAGRHSSGASHACASHRRSNAAHHKRKRHHAGHRSIDRKNVTSRPVSAVSHALAEEAASCEDGAIPTRAADGAYTCADGSAPECQNGSEPILDARLAQLLCPAASSGIEWSEATCDDGSAPTQSAGGYICEDGTAPECEDGSTPVVLDESSLPICLESGSKDSSGSPAPDSSEEEDGE